MSRLSDIWSRVKHGKPAFEGYTFDLNKYPCITEEDYECVTAVEFPGVAAPRRRWLDHKPDRKATGY